MCLPPDVTAPSAVAEGLVYDDDFGDDGVGWEPESLPINPVLSAASAQLLSAALMRKRPLESSDGLSYNFQQKVPKLAAPVTSAFDAAAASFVARMEHSMLRGGPQKQQSVPQEQTQLQQLQQLLLLKNLQDAQAAEAPPSISEQQQALLAAQQRLLRQSQSKMLNSLAPASAPSLFGSTGGISAEAKIQALLKAGAAAAGPAVASSLVPIAPAPSASAFAMGTAFPLFGDATTCAAQGLDEEKKVKRMESNRASAKRSRQRKQQRLEELDKSTSALHDENQLLCCKLQEAQDQIVELEEKNQCLTGEVATLRKMLGLEHSGSMSKTESTVAVSASPNPQSTADWSGDAPNQVEVKASLEDKPLEAGKCTWTLPEVSKAMGSVGSPRSGITHSPSFDQLLTEGDVFSELLACLEA